MDKKKNMFGHPSIAVPSNDRIKQMAQMLQQAPESYPEAEEAPTDPQVMPVGDLESLIFLGAIEDSLVINGYTFDFRTLTSKEQNDIWLSVSFLSNDTKFFVVKIFFLARAIKAVNGRALDILYKGQDFRELTKEQRAVKVLENWQDTLINELYDFYSQLLDRSKKTIRQEDIVK